MALNTGGITAVDSVACVSAENCAACEYSEGMSNQGFVVDERNGKWGKAIGVGGLGNFGVNDFANAYSVSCASAGNCAAIGIYTGFAEQGSWPQRRTACGARRSKCKARGLERRRAR